MITPNRHVFLSCLLYLVYLTIHAQDVRSVRLTEYTENSGLSSNYVTKILNDGYGFLWVGTQEGLNVFDGNHFQSFSSQSIAKRNIGGSIIQSLVVDNERSLVWVQPGYANICAMDLKSRTIVNFLTKNQHDEPFSELWMRSMYLQKDVLWLGGLNNLTAYHIPSGSYLDLTHIESELKDSSEYNIIKIFQDNANNIWLLNEGSGIIIINSDLQIVKKYNVESFNKREDQKLLFWDAAINGKHVHIASSWGLMHFESSLNNKQILLSNDVPKAFSNREIRSLEWVSADFLVVASSNHTYMYDISNQNISRLEDERFNSKALNAVFDIFYDQSYDLVWLGTQSGLYSILLEKGAFSSFGRSKVDQQSIDHLYSILPVTGDELYVGGQGLYHANVKTNTIKKIDTTSTNLLLFKDSNNNIFASNESGIHQIKNNRISPTQFKNPVQNQLSQNLFNAFLYYNDSLMILSSIIQKGLTVWNTNALSLTTYHHDSIDYQIPGLHISNSIFKAENQEVYILTEKSIIQFNPIDESHHTYIIKDPADGKTITNFMDMNESNDSYFLGTYGQGMIETDKQFNVKKIYTTKDGLSNNCVYRIFNIKDKSILATSNAGLSILNLKTQTFSRFYEGDGLHGNGFEQLCGYQRDNKIYAGGPGGFTVINTDLLPETSPAPLLYPTGIHIDTQDGKIDSTHLFMSSFTIPNDAFKTTLNFVAPDYKNPQRMTYRYKIKELSNEWVDLGNQNFVDLIGINPGTYHFEVTATNSVGMDSEPLEIELNFQPKWYQTFWFKLLLLVAIVILIYLIQRYRMTQIRNQQRIRTEIANDLHDDIGSTLNSLKIFTHLAQYEPDNKVHLSQIEKSITNATVGLRDMIWVLEGEQDSVYDLVERIKKFAHPVCLADDIVFETKVDAESDLLISKKIKRNLLLIAKECINNSIKYAKCKHIEVILEYAKPNLNMTIQDDGKGFNIEEANMGKGLESIQYRARQIQFECKIETANGQGTKTVLVSK